MTLRWDVETKVVSECCEVLRSIRHRSLLPILTTCSTLDGGGHDFKALVYEFMHNGNMDVGPERWQCNRKMLELSSKKHSCWHNQCFGIFTPWVDGLLSIVIWSPPMYFLIMIWMHIWEISALQASLIPGPHVLNIQIQSVQSEL